VISTTNCYILTFIFAFTVKTANWLQILRFMPRFCLGFSLFGREKNSSRIHAITLNLASPGKPNSYSPALLRKYHDMYLQRPQFKTQTENFSLTIVHVLFVVFTVTDYH